MLALAKIAALIGKQIVRLKPVPINLSGSVG
jgi:hypothetical protein